MDSRAIKGIRSYHEELCWALYWFTTTFWVSTDAIESDWWVLGNCEEMSACSESQIASKWKWLCLIFAIWEWSTQKATFKELYSGEREPRGNSNLQWIYKSPEFNLRICMHILFYSLWTISHEMNSHMCKQQNNYSLSQQCLSDKQSQTESN